MKACRTSALAASICVALGAGPAGAATFSVTSTSDSGAGSLRDALAQAGQNDEADIIDLSAINGQTIALTSGELFIEGDELTLEGAGATVDAQGDSTVLVMREADVTLNDLTITGGFASSQQIQEPGGIGPPDSGGGISASGAYMVLEINGSTISGNESSYEGGALALFSTNGSLTIRDSVITGNTAGSEGGGVFVSKYGGILQPPQPLGIEQAIQIDIQDSVISDNDAGDFGGGLIAIGASGGFSITGSEISGNTAYGAGGGMLVNFGSGQISVNDSVISGNQVVELGPEFVVRAGEDRRVEAMTGFQRGIEGDGSGPGSRGGGAGLAVKYQDGAGDGVFVENTTVSGNTADYAAGLDFYSVDAGISILATTISGNEAGDAAGGGVLASEAGDMRIRNSTVSGNTAGNAIGGLLLGDFYYGSIRGIALGSAVVDFTTITNNSAPGIGGLGLARQSPATINASVIAGNSAKTQPDIGFDPDFSAQANLNFSLVGVDPTSGTLNKDPTSSSLTGQDPQLGPLADNGGPAFTHLPGPDSPLIGIVPAGTLGCGSEVAQDERGEPRPLGGGCDIGSVEQGSLAPPIAVPVLDRIGLLLMAGLLGLAGLFGFRRRSRRQA